MTKEAFPFVETTTKEAHRFVATTSVVPPAAIYIEIEQDMGDVTLVTE